MKGAFSAKISERLKTRTPYFHWKLKSKGGVQATEMTREVLRIKASKAVKKEQVESPLGYARSRLRKDKRRPPFSFAKC